MDERLKFLRRKTYQPIILYLAKVSFKSEAEIKTFSDKQKLRKSVASIPVLQEMFFFFFNFKEEENDIDQKLRSANRDSMKE